MANIKSFPNNQDVYIGAEDVMKWLHGRTSGVFAADGNASVSALTDSTMAVTVSDGLGWMANAGKDGVVWWIDNEAVKGSKLQLNIDPADGVLNRIDRIIVEWKTTNYVDYPEVKVLKGTNSSKASAPALTNNSTVRQISLAKINVAAGTTAITSSMITDERLNASVCGLVTESVGIDTSVMQNQFNELLSAIQKELQDLNEDTASLLKAGGTMYGNIDMDNNRILNVAIPENAFDAVNKEYADTKLSMERIWEKGNVSTGSEFIGQTIDNISLNDNDFVLVIYQVSSNGSVFTSEIIRPGTLVRAMGIISYTIAYRDTTCRTDKITFSSGSIIKTYGSAPTTDNKCLIPRYIYRIKGASE